MYFLSFLTGALMLQSGVAAEAADTLDGAVVSQERTVVVSRIDTVKNVNACSTDGVAYLLGQIPGLQLNDYGSAAGLKTISIRGMGTTHTSVLVDGIEVNNVQSGQIDLGMLDLGSIDELTVDYVGSTINLKSARPVFDDGERFSGKLSFAGGSFDTYSPSVRLNLKLGDRTSMRVYGNAYWTKGDYEYGEGSIRENNDLTQFKGGVDFWGTFKDQSGEWSAKAYYNNADRGCPGSLSWLSSDRQKDNDCFIQGGLRRNVTDLYSFRVNAKVSHDRMRYLSETYQNYYNETGLLLNSSHNLSFNRWFSMAADVDLRWTDLNSDLYQASRLSADASVSAFVNLARFKAQAKVNYIGAYDDRGVNRSCFSPLLAVRYMPVDWLEFTASGRRAYRVPTFNDLYYTGIGNTDLLPEDAWMTEAGVALKRTLAGSWQLKVNVNGFYNSLKNKIVSAPTDDPYIWMMYNLGSAEVMGVDAASSFAYSSDNWQAGLSVAYTFQGGTSIPYNPRHKVKVSANAEYRGWGLSAIWNYHSSALDSYDVELKSWNTLDINAYKSWKSFTFRLSGRNILSSRYEVISGYPMPPACFVGEVVWTF